MSTKIRCLNPECNNYFDVGTARKYCSENCKQKAYRLRQKTSSKFTSQTFVKSCTNCGNKFTTRIRTQEFCKTSCRVSFWQQQKRIAAWEAK